MTKIRYWSMDRFVLMIVKMLLNKFDCFIVIEGNRGLGKSTIAYKLLSKVHRVFKIIQAETSLCKGWYEFKPLMQLKYPMKYRHVIYTQKDVINFFDKWHRSAIADEMINVAFNREFFSEDQKNLVKLINMNRDHGNLFVACVPQFQTLDNQIKNLCKIRITVARRGLAVIQTPNRTIYNRDRWDSSNNERIERDWLRKGSGLPQYSRLNTFRGMIRFHALTPKEQWIYDQIKQNERNVIKGSLGVTEEQNKDVYDIAVERLLAGTIVNGHILDGMAVANELNPIAFRDRVRRKLQKIGKPTALAQYYSDKRARQQDVVSIT